MNITQLTKGSGVSQEEIDKVGARKINSDADGTTFLVFMEIEGKTSSAIIYMPEDSARGEFVCAGKTGSWMGRAADDYISERNYMIDADADAQVGELTTDISEEVFTIAFLNGFQTIAHPNGELSMRQVHEGFDLAITNDIWIKERSGFMCPSAVDTDWTVSRMDHEAGLETGSVDLLEATNLQDALGSCLMLADDAIAERSDPETFIAAREDLIRMVGWYPEFAMSEDMQLAADLQESEMTHEVEFSGQLRMF